jgi:hypothetical protein
LLVKYFPGKSQTTLKNEYKKFRSKENRNQSGIPASPSNGKKEGGFFSQSNFPFADGSINKFNDFL